MDIFLIPLEILSKEKFDQPTIISPNVYKSFDELYKQKEHISYLRLVPVKHDIVHKLYHDINHDYLIQELQNFFIKNSIFIMDNKFPYWLPEDVDQKIIWLNDDVNDQVVLNFLKTEFFKLSDQRAIVFERPLNISTKFVKGSFPAYRHIHFWTKKK